ncbi:MAG: hypothetical protein GKR90_08665 [Pseudomonadales bacterium]|nr:hypothetical protein [Pseudomonadales bacterium]
MSASNSATNAQSPSPSEERQSANSASERTPEAARGTAPEKERRNGVADRRSVSPERRNEDRLADDLEPRRNPDTPDRRA